MLVLVSAYDGPLDDVLRSYAGNVAVSFALYFAVANAAARSGRPRLAAASLALVAVWLFEATDGFGIMANTFDPLDFIADAAGVGLAVVVDAVTTSILGRRHERSRDGSGGAPT